MVTGISEASSMWSQMGVRSMRPSKEQMFNKMDQNSDGSIDKTEMQTVLEKMTEQSNQAVNVDDLFTQYDSDGDGNLSRDETDTAMKSLRTEAGRYGTMQGNTGAGPMPPPPDFGELFDDTDTDADGSISESELTTLLEKMKGDSDQTVDVSALFKTYDSDGDGQLNEAETKSALESLRGSDSNAGGMNAMRPMPPPPPDFSNIFKDADTDSDGSIGKSELQTLADKISSGSGQTISIEDLLSQNDSDSDGKLSESEAKKAMASLFEALNPDSSALKKLFYENSSYNPIDVIA